VTAPAPSLLKSLPPGLGRVMAATTLVVLSFSLLNPVLAVRLQQAGVSATGIGLFATLPFVAVAALVPLVPTLFMRLGVGQAYRLGLVLEVFACLG
jgi:cyanate permease